ncbi:MAG: hypothetical protein HXL57_00240 [Solobacterium sp.]|jgi:hypothetical protein|nr:hypothetical protein [Solobacterium sp.]DAM47434.1 MAG TPA: hypothetical protein [Caudoviricetes sp.]
MILTHDNDFEVLGDSVIEVSPLKDLSQELLDEFISIQIKEPFEMRTNFVENFTDEVDLLAINNGDDEDYVKQIRDEANEFYLTIIHKIEDQFRLDIDPDVIDALDRHGIQNVCEALYEFFTVNYTKNVAKYLARVTLGNVDVILDELANNEKAKDVSTMALKQKVDDEVFATLLANINLVVSIAKDINIEPIDMMQYFNQDNFDVSVIRYCIEEHVINGNFRKPFLDLIFDNDQDYVYDGIVADVYQYFLQQYAELKMKAQESMSTELGGDIDGEYADANNEY